MCRRSSAKKISPQCAYCEIGRTAADSTVLCEKKGVMQPYSHCKKFKYDPLKRQPLKKTPDSNFKAEDFSL